jgi:UPF0755 protein
MTAARRHGGTGGRAGHDASRASAGPCRRARRIRAPVPLCLCALLCSCSGPAPGAPHERFFVPKRASLHTVADSLAAHHIISSTRGFLLSARVLSWFEPQFRGLDRHLNPGRYEFAHGERTKKILEDMLKGNTADDYFTVPEGYTTWEIAHDAHRRLGMDSAAFVTATRDTSLLRRLGVPRGVKTVEGYLFPETYRVVFGASPEQLVEQMVQMFLAHWDTTMDRRAAALHFTRHQVVTLASIVEAEARRNSERRIIAGVYTNRLRRKHPMRLEADPTVIYAMGKHVTRVLKTDLQNRSPYNTYKHAGLPPGPIASPGRPSILATLWPGQHEFLYFVARPDGTHMFSRTWEEHTDSVKVARRLRAEWRATKDSLDRAARRDSMAAAAARRAARSQ